MARRGAAFALFALGTSFVAPAASQQATPPTYCIDCQARRWHSVEQETLKAAANVKRARDLLRRAEKKGDAALLARVKKLLSAAETKWKVNEASARALGGNSYNVFLAKNLVDVEARYDAARAALKNKTDQFRRLEESLGEQRKKILADMQGTIKEEEHQRMTLGFNGVISGFHGAAAWAEMEIHALSAGGGAAANGDRIALLKRVVAGEQNLTSAKIGYQFATKQYWEVAADLGQVTLEKILTPASQYFPAAAALPQLTSLVLDAAAIGQSHLEFYDARDRLDSVFQTEARWQDDIRALGAEMHNLDSERKMAVDAIARQRAFAGQLRKIDQEMTP